MIKGMCAKCGCIFEINWNHIECPACLAVRIERVRQAFAPVDALRTAMGIPGSFTVSSRGELMEVKRSPYEHDCYQPAGAGFDPKDCPACAWADEQGQAEVPRDMKMPTGDAAVYELKRLFRK